MNIACGILEGKKIALERWQKENNAWKCFFTISNFAIIEKNKF